MDVSSSQPPVAVFSAYATPLADGQYRVMVMVDGVHCAACIQKIESALLRDVNVSRARLNFSTKRLTIEWRGDASQADDLVGRVAAQGYRVHPFDVSQAEAESDATERFLQICLGVSAFASFNTMLIAEALWFSDGEMGQATRDLLHWVSAAIAVPSTFYAGQPFFRSAWTALKNGKANMDVPISLGVLGAIGVSIWQTIIQGTDVYFDSAVSLLFFLLIGRYLDFRARRKARSAATDLLAMMAGTAIVVDRETGQQSVIPMRDVREGMTVFVPMGQRIPADAIVEIGISAIDTSLVTGETMPRDVSEGSEVFAGTLNLNAPLTLRVTAANDDSLLSDIVRLMEKAEQGQAHYTRIADKVAKHYTPVVHTLAAVTLLGWWLWGGASLAQSILIAVTVLIITCPCALGLAVPVVQVLATGRLMKQKILVKSGDALERMASIDTVLLDKTGTLTLGKPVLQPMGDDAHSVLPLAASLARQSHHPLSKALASAYTGESVMFEKVIEEAGKGLEAIKDGVTYRLGRRGWSGDGAQTQSDEGLQEIWFAVNNQPTARFCFRDTLRPDAQQVIHDIKAAGLRPILLSGDRAVVVTRVAKEIGLDEAYGELSPIDKYRFMDDMRAKGHRVAMVGDGLNDAPTLVGADVSLSPSSAIDMAQNAADIVFMGDELGAVVETHRTARFAGRLVRQNLWLALLYNVIAVPIAVAGLVTPLIAAIAMSASSLVVIANSFRLNTIKKGREG